MHVRFTNRLVALTIVAFSLLASSPAFAQSPWTTVGSTGTPDELDLAKVRFNTTSVEILPAAAASTTARLRYNVTATSDLEEGVNKTLTVRFRDNGANARVLVYLIRQSIDTGATATILSFDSDTRPALTGFQNWTVGDGCWAEGFDFNRYTYHVEVVLSRTALNGLPSVSALSVADLDLC